MNNVDSNQKWVFKSYVDSRYAEVIQDWYDAASPAAKAEFDVVLDVLRCRKVSEWSDTNYVKSLIGKKDLFELRFKAEKIPYRPIGCFGIGRLVFTILIMSTKGDFERNCAKALKRRDKVFQDPERYSNESKCLSRAI